MDGLTYGRAAVLGVLQGLTEFLPVSSSGHLVLAKDLLGLTLPGLTLEIMLHVGTALAVAVFMRRDIGRMIAAVLRWDRFDPAFGEAWMLLLASVPAALAGILFGDIVETRLSAPRFAALMLLVTAVILILGPRGARGQERAPAAGPALLIGLFQAVAIVPGISRSGSTVVAGLRAGLTRDGAARFALLLSLPVIFGGAVIDAIGLAGSGVQSLPLGPLAVGMACSFVCGLFAINVLIAAARRAALSWFGLYCAIAGGLVLLLAR